MFAAHAHPQMLVRGLGWGVAVVLRSLNELRHELAHMQRVFSVRFLRTAPCNPRRNVSAESLGDLLGGDAHRGSRTRFRFGAYSVIPQPLHSTERCESVMPLWTPRASVPSTRPTSCSVSVDQVAPSAQPFGKTVARTGPRPLRWVARATPCWSSCDGSDECGERVHGELVGAECRRGGERGRPDVEELVRRDAEVGDLRGAVLQLRDLGREVGVGQQVVQALLNVERPVPGTPRQPRHHPRLSVEGCAGCWRTAAGGSHRWVPLRLGHDVYSEAEATHVCWSLGQRYWPALHPAAAPPAAEEGSSIVHTPAASRVNSPSHGGLSAGMAAARDATTSHRIALEVSKRLRVGRVGLFRARGAGRSRSISSLPA